jgi:hypothetical protein
MQGLGKATSYSFLLKHGLIHASKRTWTLAYPLGATNNVQKSKLRELYGRCEPDV